VSRPPNGRRRAEGHAHLRPKSRSVRWSVPIGQPAALGLQWDNRYPSGQATHKIIAGNMVPRAEQRAAGSMFLAHRAEGDAWPPAGTSIPGASQRVPVDRYGLERTRGKGSPGAKLSGEAAPVRYSFPSCQSSCVPPAREENPSYQIERFA